MSEWLERWVQAQEWRESTVLPESPTLAAAAYLAVLAYPDSFDKRDGFIDVVRAWMGRRFPDQVGHATVPQMRPRDIGRGFDRAARRIEIRCRAAALATQVVQSRQGGNIRFEGPDRIKAGMNAFDDDAERVRIHIGFGKQPPAPPRVDVWEDEDNARQRKWVPSKPVLHLAHSFRFSLPDNEPLRMDRLLLRPSWVGRAVQDAPGMALTLCIHGIVEPGELVFIDLPAPAEPKTEP